MPHATKASQTRKPRPGGVHSMIIRVSSATTLGHWANNSCSFPGSSPRARPAGSTLIQVLRNQARPRRPMTGRGRCSGIRSTTQTHVSATASSMALRPQRPLLLLRLRSPAIKHQGRPTSRQPSVQERWTWIESSRRHSRISGKRSRSVKAR